ncbi:hypothetical protein SDC9_196575 [bioreactor metagenome]|uniref:Uncharacterized protein n=1 Tax=bioreactor metagenome TaxID=1076179 RepID=A0A645IDP5_9ZZZZ
MPSAPEFGDRTGDIWIVEVLLIAKSEHAPKTNRHIGIRGEVEVNLHRKDRTRKPACRNGCARLRQRGEHLTQHVRQQHLFA